MKIVFDTKFFQKRNFDEKTISRYFRNACKDFRIAFKNKEPEVVFNFSYNSLLKLGITLIAFHGYRVKARRGHHTKILEKLSHILQDQNIEVIGEAMRKKRNLDLYDGGIIVSVRESKYYLNFVKTVIQKTERYLKSQYSLF